MATLTVTTTISSPAGDILSDALALNLSNAYALDGDVSMDLVEVSTAAGSGDAAMTLLIANSGRGTKSGILYLKNTGATGETITVYTDTADDNTITLADEDFLTIKAGEFAIFPWAGTHDLWASTAAGAPKMEVGYFAESAA